MKTIRVKPETSYYEAVVMVDKIKSLSKNSDGSMTRIDFIDGDFMWVFESLNTIEARINGKGQENE